MLSDCDTLPSIQLGDYLLRFELEELGPKGQEIAARELRETPEIKAQAITELRNLLKGKLIFIVFLLYFDFRNFICTLL